MASCKLLPRLFGKVKFFIIFMIYFNSSKVLVHSVEPIAWFEHGVFHYVPKNNSIQRMNYEWCLENELEDNYRNYEWPAGFCWYWWVHSKVHLKLWTFCLNYLIQWKIIWTLFCKYNLTHTPYFYNLINYFMLLGFIYYWHFCYFGFIAHFNKIILLILLFY